DDDALPGVKGLGAKSATSLLETYGTVAAALAAAGELKGRLGNALRAAEADIPRELARARLDRRRPLPVPLEQLGYRPPAPGPVNELYERLGFAELLAHDGAEIRTDVCESPEAVTAVLARLGGQPIAIHALLEDPAPIHEALAGIALSVGDGTACYVAAGSRGWPALAAWLADPGEAKLGHELISAIIALARMGITLAGVAGDSAFASHLSQPSNWAPHDLPVIAKHVLGRALPDEDAVRGVGRARKPWAALAIDRAAAVAGQGADASAAIWHKLAPDLDPALLASYHALQDLLVRMEQLGVAVERGQLTSAEVAFAELEVELAAQIEALAGHAFNINSSKQLGSVLFEELKLPIASHTKTGWSTSIEALERIEHAHPIVALVLRWRLLRRLRDNWLHALHRSIDVDGRVHSRFYPARSFSGHLISTNPDLSRVPGRTPEMARIRRAFVAPPGRLLMSVDYHQLGLYVLAHLTGDPALVEPLRARADMHALTASAVLDKPLDAITPDERQLGKVVNFATFAGQGASALALQLNVSPAEAKQLIARFDQRYAQVRAFQDEQLRLAR
ncbi:MAG TPA: DNA polymerase, partial [Kofleriaceae bacterium]